MFELFSNDFNLLLIGRDLMKIKLPKYMEKDLEKNDLNILKEIEKELISSKLTNDICIFSDKVYLNGKKISVPLIFFNNTDKIIGDIEIKVAFSIYGKVIFNGAIAFKKDMYDKLLPQEGVLDYWILELAGEQGEMEIIELKKDEFNLQIIECHEICYE